jgi:hypothetical protein
MHEGGGRYGVVWVLAIIVKLALCECQSSHTTNEGM